MSEPVLATMKGILLDPTPTFQLLRDEPPGEALKYYAILLLIPTVLITSLIATIGRGSQNIPDFAIAFAGVGIFAVGLITLFINGFICHILGVCIADSHEGIEQTIKALAYASTPGLLLGWIPVVNIITGIWTLILFILGIRELQNLSTRDAVLAAILPFAIITIILTITIISVFGTT